MTKKVLGKGLGAIITASPTPVQDFEKGVSEDAGRIVEIEAESILPNPDQPRTHFDPHGIEGLAESIRAAGLIQPIIVRKAGSAYTVVAGERRLRATKLAGLKKIRAIVIEADEVQNLTLALIENIQRSDLDPIEEAEAYRVLISRFSLKQQDIASRVGKERATITNSLRLLNLPEPIKRSLSSGEISVGHAKVLLSVEEDRQMDLYRAAKDRGLSVRALEALISETKKSPKKDRKKNKDAHIRKMEEKLISKLGTKVEIKHSGGKGRIEISYYSLDDFERIIDLIK
ncbi:MAG: ParB/RepB/Spo0J family partition protein [Spirochaetes bacterium]|jgi:ParB family chromosome partitioning protein|nr:ParB/RepB/Spo0J family partition protein [Spirochaetota bacterium]